VLAVVALIAGFAVIGVAGALERPRTTTTTTTSTTAVRRERAADAPGARPTGPTGRTGAEGRTDDDTDPRPTTTTSAPPVTSTTRVADPTDPARCGERWPATADAPPTVTDVAAARTGTDRAVVTITFRSPCGIAFFGDGPPRRASASSIGLILRAPCSGSRFTVVSGRDPERFGAIGAQEGIPGTCEGGADGAIHASDADLVAGTWTDGTLSIPLRLVRCPSNGALVPSLDLSAWDGAETFLQPDWIAATWPDAVLACGP
jgi:hypothetical protein